MNTFVTTNKITGQKMKYYLNEEVDKIKAVNMGCYNSTVCVSIFLYAGDILLLAPSVTGLQAILAACENELDNIGMRINVKKSMCIRFGKLFNVPCSKIISTHGGPLEWVNSCRYLGVYFTSGRLFRCCFDNAKSSFFKAFNSILGKVGRFASDEVVLSLLRSKCLPCLLYGVEACPVYTRDKRSFDFTLTRTFMKLFRTGSPAVVKDCQLHFNFLPLRYQIDIRTVKFMKQFCASTNSICTLFSQDASKIVSCICVTYGEYINSVPGLYRRIVELNTTT